MQTTDAISFDNITLVLIRQITLYLGKILDAEQFVLLLSCSIVMYTTPVYRAEAVRLFKMASQLQLVADLLLRERACASR
jgi:hypothetical protein